MSIQSVIRRAAVAAVVLAILLLPLGSAAARTSPNRQEAKTEIAGGAPALRSWHTLMTETFEGMWPPAGIPGGPAWISQNMLDSDPLALTWDDTSARAHLGYWSAHPSAGANPPGSFFTEMLYGPFSLVGAVNARVNFYYWLDSNMGDTLIYGYSCNGGWTWKETAVSGPLGAASHWTAVTMSIKACKGKPGVWVRWAYITDWYDEGDEGAYVDDIRIQSYY